MLIHFLVGHTGKHQEEGYFQCLVTNSFLIRELVIAINLKINQMSQSANSASIFTPIHSDVVSSIQKDVLSLHSIFWVNNNKNQQIHVLLSNHHIALAQKQVQGYNYLYSTPINFELKFQVIFEGDRNPNPSQNSIHSKPIGFRLLKQDAMAVEFDIVDSNVLPIWLKYLGKMLNEVGFHKIFKPLRKLGKGGFATVYQVQRLTDGKLFAVKAFSKQSTIFSKNESHKLNLLNEIAMMRAIDHPNLIKMEAVFQSQNSLYVVLELLNQGHLHNKINKREGHFSMAQVKTIMTGLIKGLKHCHSLNIMHRDIKPENIMLKNGLEPVLADFGLSTYCHADDYIFYRCGTPGYVAPQVAKLEKGQKISYACDIFSAGVIFHILLMAKPLFGGKKFEQVYDNNKNMRFNLQSSAYSNVDSQAMDLLSKMLKVNPAERLTANQVLHHPFLGLQAMQEEKPSPPTHISSLKQKQQRAC